MPAILFDLGGTYLRSAISDDSGKILTQSIQKKRIDSFLHNSSEQSLWKKIISSMVHFEGSARSSIPSDAPIVCSFPGPIKQPAQILDAPTVIGESTGIRDLAADLTGLTGRQVYIINDISAAAWYFSQKVSVNRFIVVTVSSGIGSKIFDRDHPLGVLDNVPYSGEIGHAMVDPNYHDIKCDCGGKGHLGAISSGRGIERFARRIACEQTNLFSESACVTKFGASLDNLTNENHLVPAASSLDPWALNVIKTCTYPLARVLLNVVLASGLEKVVVIGGFALTLGNVYLEILRDCLMESSDYKIICPYIHDLVIMGGYTEEACLEGAAVYAQRLPVITS